MEKTEIEIRCKTCGKLHMEIGLIGKVNYDFKCKRCKNTNVGVITRMWRATMAKNNKELIKEVVEELRKSNLINYDYLTPYQKTEKLISSYNLLRSSITRKINLMEDIEKNGLTPKNSGITERVKGGTENYKSDIEKKEDRLEFIKQDISFTENIVMQIESALESIKDDKYYKIIELKYFNKKTLEEIADEFDVDVRTIKRNKNRIINDLSAMFISTNDLKKLIEF